MTAGSVQLEIRYERDEAIPLRSDDYSGPVLRVRYRLFGARRWVRFLLVPNEGQTIDQLEATAGGAVYAHWAMEQAARQGRKS